MCLLEAASEIDEFRRREGRELLGVVGVSTDETCERKLLNERFFGLVLFDKRLVRVPETKELFIAHRLDAVLKIRLVDVVAYREDTEYFLGEFCFRSVFFFRALKRAELCHDFSMVTAGRSGSWRCVEGAFLFSTEATRY